MKRSLVWRLAAGGLACAGSLLLGLGTAVADPLDRPAFDEGAPTAGTNITRSSGPPSVARRDPRLATAMAAVAPVPLITPIAVPIMGRMPVMARIMARRRITWLATARSMVRHTARRIMPVAVLAASPITLPVLPARAVVARARVGRRIRWLIAVPADMATAAAAARRTWRIVDTIIMARHITVRIAVMTITMARRTTVRIVDMTITVARPTTPIIVDTASIMVPRITVRSVAHNTAIMAVGARPSTVPIADMAARRRKWRIADLALVARPMLALADLNTVVLVARRASVVVLVECRASATSVAVPAARLALVPQVVVPAVLPLVARILVLRDAAAIRAEISKLASLAWSASSTPCSLN